MQWTANFQKRRVTNLGGTFISERNGTNQIGWGISINLRQYGFITPKLGWVFPSQENESDLWLWSPQLEWLWLEKETF